jgi:hypothetical protein
MGRFEDEVAEFERDYKDKPLKEVWKNGIRYDSSGGYGYQLFNNTPQARKGGAREIIEQTGLDKLKQAIENW